MSVPLAPKQFQEKPNRMMPKTKVRLDKVVATQNKVDHSKVMDIASKPAGDITPPLVHGFKGKYYVSDGHHRVAGAIERGDTHIVVRKVK